MKYILLIIIKGAFVFFICLFGYDFFINSYRLIKKKLVFGNSVLMIGGML